jgi:hypothetical protein
MKKNDILLILIPLSLFVLMWIGFSIYHSVVTSTISQPLSVQITPITPDFDINTITDLKTRETIVPIYESSMPTIVPTPAMINTINSSTSAIQATSEGSLLR